MEGAGSPRGLCVFKVSLKEWGWEMELTLQDDIGAVNFKTVSVCGTHLHCFHYIQHSGYENIT